MHIGVWGRVGGQGMRLERQAGLSLPPAVQVMVLSLATKSGLETASLQTGGRASEWSKWRCWWAT